MYVYVLSISACSLARVLYALCAAMEGFMCPIPIDFFVVTAASYEHRTVAVERDVLRVEKSTVKN